jgi:hypothetical protein
MQQSLRDEDAWPSLNGTSVESATQAHAHLAPDQAAQRGAGGVGEAGEVVFSETS